MISVVSDTTITYSIDALLETYLYVLVLLVSASFRTRHCSLQRNDSLVYH